MNFKDSVFPDPVTWTSYAVPGSVIDVYFLLSFTFVRSQFNSSDFPEVLSTSSHREDKGKKEHLGNEEGERSGKQVLLKDLPAASLTSLFVPSLSVSQEKYSLSLCSRQSKPS